MKATELRIGNYTLNGRVVELTYDDIVVTDGFTIWRQSSGLEIEPIPLTGEWLRRFGFNVSKLGINSLYLGLLEYSDGNVYIDEGRGLIAIDHVKHVHQLQNLYFALTGEELTLK